MFARSWFRLALGLLLGGLLAVPGLTRAGDKASPDAKQLQQQIKELQDQVKALQERVQALEKGQGGFFPGRPGFKGPGGAGFPAGKQFIKATVKSFDKGKETAVFTVPADSGIKVGQSLMVMRAGRTPYPLGMVEVKEVSGKEVTAHLKKGPFPLPPQAGTFAVNDEVNRMVFSGFAGGRPPFPPFKKDKEKEKDKEKD